MKKKVAVAIPSLALKEAEDLFSASSVLKNQYDILTVFSDDLPLSDIQNKNKNITIRAFQGRQPSKRYLLLRDKLEEYDENLLIPGLSPLKPEEETVYLEEGFYSPDLENYLSENTRNYSEILVLDGGSTFGLRILLSAVHPEITAVFLPGRNLYLGRVMLASFRSARILAESKNHSEFLRRCFGPSAVKAISVCEEIRQGPAYLLEAFENRCGLLEAEPEKVKINKYYKLLNKFSSVHQLLPTLTTGDAISNHVIFIRSLIRSMGYHSEIFVENRDSAVSNLCRYYRPGVLNPDDLVIYHHSIGTSLTAEVARHPGPKMLIYHNITPPDFYEPFNPKFVNILKKGLDDLHNLSSQFDACAGVSQFNVDDLHRYGFKNGEILPIIVDPQRWKIIPDRKLMTELSDGGINIIFVGRLSPNKKQEELIDIFYHLKARHPHARLFLVGDGAGQARYVQSLFERIWKYQCGESIFITGKVTESQLCAYYRTAHLFLSMSEHEGFGVPLIEAMWFDIPVVALSAAAVPETMGDGGILIGKDSAPVIADLLSVILENPDLRKDIIISQRKNALRFLPENLKDLYTVSIGRLAEKFLKEKKKVFI